MISWLNRQDIKVPAPVKVLTPYKQSRFSIVSIHIYCDIQTYLILILLVENADPQTKCQSMILTKGTPKKESLVVESQQLV